MLSIDGKKALEKCTFDFYLSARQVDTEDKWQTEFTNLQKQLGYHACFKPSNLKDNKKQENKEKPYPFSLIIVSSS